MTTTVLINTSQATAEIAKVEPTEGTAHKVEAVDGYILKLTIGKEVKTLSTYLSDKPRLFKRSDALLKEAKNLGLKNVNFIL